MFANYHNIVVVGGMGLENIFLFFAFFSFT